MDTDLDIDVCVYVFVCLCVCACTYTYSHTLDYCQIYLCLKHYQWSWYVRVLDNESLPLKTG